MTIERKWSGKSHLDDDEDNQDGIEVDVTEYPYFNDNWDEVGSTAVVKSESGNWISVIDFNEQGEGAIRHCPHCKEYGFEIRLGVKIKKHGEKPAPDDDKWVSCHQCGNTFPLHETNPEPKLKVPTRTTDNPFQEDSIFLSIDTRATERRKGKKRSRSKAGEHEDPEIRAEINKGNRVNILYDSSR